MRTQEEVTFGVMVGNRGFFPDHLCKSGRETILKVLKKAGIKVITLGPDDTPYGSVESLEDAHKCADLFKKHRDEIDGVLVTLPNFGDERAVANTLRWADIRVPVMLHAFPDEAEKMTIANRRDAFCGKLSAANNLSQYGIRFSLTTLHTVDPESESFQTDLQNFVSTCRVVQGLRQARIGVLGARPAAFNTVRYSEKLLERSGISVESLDLSEVFGAASKLSNSDPAVKGKLDEITAYISTTGIPREALEKMACLGVVIERWMAEKELVASALQCWTSMEEYYGVVPCALMSMMSDRLLPSACETDIGGVIGMYAMVLASGQPSAITDWNNNYGDDPDTCVVFHCSNLPKGVFLDEGTLSNCRHCTAADLPRMDYQEIIAGTVGKENTFGTIVGRIKPGPFTFCRVATNDFKGRIDAYLGEGEFTDDSLDTFGGYGVARIPRLQELLQHICKRGFEHHVAINHSRCSQALDEAFTTYLDWEVYHHGRD